MTEKQTQLLVWWRYNNIIKVSWKGVWWEMYGREAMFRHSTSKTLLVKQAEGTITSPGTPS